jgi:2-polyprenyl-6-methoxyphenol hydroxylase-like FAD-dependent oxidoreductase
MERMGGHAVVLGASMAGLLAARVLADSYGRVTLVERDVLPETGEQRRGVPQGRHVHALLARGGQVLDGLFPGLTAEVVSAGAPAGDLLGGIRWLLSGYRLRQADIAQPVLFPSRPMLEAHVRDRVLALPPVTVLDGHTVLELTTDGRAVTGVRVAGGAGAVRTLDADLVVDATGRGSRTPVWLEQLGYPRPRADRVEIGVGYASRPYRLPPDALGTDKLILHSWTLDHPRAGALAAQEGGRFLVTLAGMLGDHPPTDLKGFRAFAASMPGGDIFRAIDSGEPDGEPAIFKYPANVRHRYDLLRRFPEGLLVLGDAQCAFNPVYGQGMTVAALQAEVLSRVLTGGGARVWRRYFRQTARVIDAPWQIATGTDLAFPGVTGRRTAKIRVVNAYLPRLHAAAAVDPALAAAFVRVTGLLARPESLLRPDRAVRSLRHRPGVAGLLGPAPGMPAPVAAAPDVR